MTSNKLKATALSAALSMSACMHPGETQDASDVSSDVRDNVQALIEIAKDDVGWRLDDTRERLEAINGLSEYRERPEVVKTLKGLTNYIGCIGIAATASLAGRKLDYEACLERRKREEIEEKEERRKDRVKKSDQAPCDS